MNVSMSQKQKAGDESGKEAKKSFMKLVIGDSFRHDTSYRELGREYKHKAIEYFASAALMGFVDFYMGGHVPPLTKHGDFINLTQLQGSEQLITAGAVGLAYLGIEKVILSAYFYRKAQCEDGGKLSDENNIKVPKKTRKYEKLVAKADMAMNYGYKDERVMWHNAVLHFKKAARLYHKAGEHRIEHDVYLKIGLVEHGAGAQRQALKYLKRAGERGAVKVEELNLI